MESIYASSDQHNQLWNSVAIGARDQFQYLMKRSVNKLKGGTILIVSLFFFTSIAAKNLNEGTWRGTLQLNDSTELPFNFEVKVDLEIYTITFINGDERIPTNEIALHGDSAFIRMP